MRRTLAAVHHRLASGPSAIFLIVASLLASSAGLAMPFASVGPRQAALSSASVEQSVERAHERLAQPEAATRTVYVRAAGPSISRLQAPSGAGSDGVRGMAVGAASAQLELLVLRGPGATVEARRNGIASPGQPAPASRAPPG